MRRPVTDIALLAYIAKKNVQVVSYNEATKACKSSSSASRALHQLINEGLIEPKPKLTGLRYITQYVVTPKGKQAAELALQLTQLREVAKQNSAAGAAIMGGEEGVKKQLAAGKKERKKKQPSHDEEKIES